MSPRSKVRAAQIFIPVAVALGLVGAILGLWYLVVAMVLLVISQLINYRANRGRPG